MRPSIIRTKVGVVMTQNNGKCLLIRRTTSAGDSVADSQTGALFENRYHDQDYNAFLPRPIVTVTSLGVVPHFVQTCGQARTPLIDRLSFRSSVFLLLLSSFLFLIS